MNDFDGLLASDFGLKPQGKSAPMAPPSKGSSNLPNATSLNFDFGSRSARSSDSLFGSSAASKNRDTGSFDDLFAGAGSEPRGADAPFDLDSMFRGSGGDFASRSANSSPPPVYDKPVYDDDVFDGVPGLKSTAKVKFDDVFASTKTEGGAFDDLLGGFGKESKGSGRKGSEKDDKGVSDFDDLLAGFGSSRPSRDRHAPDIGLSSEPTASASKPTSAAAEDPFKVFESTSVPIDSSTGHFSDPLEEISKFSSSRSTKNDSSSTSNGRVHEDIDPFGGLGKSVPAFSSERNSSMDSSSPRLNTSTSWTRDKEPADKFSGRSPEGHSQNNIPVESDQEFPQPAFYMPTFSSDSNKSVGQRSTSPPYNDVGSRKANIQVDMSPKYEEDLESSEDVWLTVSEIPLFTQPTTAPPPARPPPPRPVHIARKKANEFSSFPSSTRFSHGPTSAPAAARVSPTSQFDELDDFAMGRSHSNDVESENGLPDEELEMNSAAAAMKEAMDRAEAKFRHAKEVREREYTKASRSKEAVQLEKDETAMLEEREKQERLERERQQKERDEKEQRRLMKEKEEKEKGRQAVERATREARERAAADARQRAERAAVGKVNAEARERAERAAVQRAQAEARERAAADAKERAEKAAAEAKQREARERAAAARAEAEARVKAERAAAERAAAEARQRAAAAARMNQQKNEDDLESFFGMGARASSVPRPPRANSTEVFETQFQSDATRKPAGASSSSSMKKASSSINIVDDLTSIFGAAPSSGQFQEVEGESEERRRARFERQQRSQERAAQALAEKNQRDLQTQREQAERHRLAETLDFEIKRWAAGKEGNLRALLSTLQYVLWPECGWQPVSLTDLITAAAVKKAYRKATLCIHPDKVQQKGATLQQKYVAEKVFDLLKEAWNKLNSEELF